MKKWCFLALSFLIVMFAQPDWSHVACIMTAICGYALFWFGMIEFTTKKARFALATFWFGAVSAIQLSWVLHGLYFYWLNVALLFVLSALLGLSFGLISLMIRRPKEMRVGRAFAVAGVAALLEFGRHEGLRLLSLTGFGLNPIGLSLGGTLAGMQMVALTGTLGLTFWVVLTNALIFRMQKLSALPVIVALFPYLFGFAHLSWHKGENSETLDALLVQTGRYEGLVQPTPHTCMEEWHRFMGVMTPFMGKPLDLVVFPENMIPGGFEQARYHGEESPFPAEKGEVIDNRWMMQQVAKSFGADAIFGVTKVFSRTSSANRAYHVDAAGEVQHHYDKRVLLPLIEYRPNLVQNISCFEHFNRFMPGKKMTLFEGKVPAVVSICYDELYGNLCRRARRVGAKVHVNLTDDRYFPRSRLALQHFYHARWRAVEEGIPVVRACNTGVTCAINANGKVVDLLPFDSKKREAQLGALHVRVPLYSYFTLYALFGDWTVLALSLGALKFR